MQGCMTATSRIIPGASGDSGIGSWRVSTEGSYGDSVLTPGESVLHIKGQLLSSEDLMLLGMWAVARGQTGSTLLGWSIDHFLEDKSSGREESLVLSGALPRIFPVFQEASAP